jgi:hypothetical protein
MFKRIVIYFICLICLSVGIMSLYRSSLTLKDMDVIKGLLLEKEMVLIHTGATSSNYTLVLAIQDLDYKLGISYSSYDDAHGDSTMRLLDTMKTYTFYVDPTIPVSRTVRCGIYKIEDSSGKQLYLESQKYNFWLGIGAILASIFFYTLYKIGLKKEEKLSSNNNI